MASGVEHFKCPNCNNKEVIAKVFQKIGIYVPQKVIFWDILEMDKRIQLPKQIFQDAEWELPGNSGFYNFQDM